MPRVEWNQQLSLGIPVIDAEHRKMVDIFNALHDVAEDTDSVNPAEVALLDELVAIAGAHFRTEEQMMRLVPDWRHRFGWHLEHHRVLLYELVELREDAARRDPGGRRRRLDFLERWLFEHMTSFDPELVEFGTPHDEPVPWLDPDH